MIVKKIFFFLFAVFAVNLLCAQIQTTGDANPKITTPVSSYTRTSTFSVGSTADGTLSATNASNLTISTLSVGTGAGVVGTVSLVDSALTLSQYSYIGTGEGTGHFSMSNSKLQFNRLHFGYTENSVGIATFSNSTVSSDSVFWLGNGTISLDNSTVSVGLSTFSGSASHGAVLTLNSSTLTMGGLLTIGYNGTASVTLTNSTLSANSSHFISYYGLSATVSLNNSTLTGVQLHMGMYDSKSDPSQTILLEINSGLASYSSTINLGRVSDSRIVVNQGGTFRGGGADIGAYAKGELLIQGGVVTLSNATLSRGEGGNGIISLNSGSLTILGNTIVGLGNTASMTVNGGTASLQGLVVGGNGLFDGRDATIGTGSFVVNGGVVEVASTVAVCSGRGTGTLSVLGGTFRQTATETFSIGVTTTNGSGSAIFSSRANEISLGNVQVGRKGKLTLKIEGGDADVVGPVITLNSFDGDAAGYYQIDLSNYTGSVDKNIELIRGGTAAEYANITWDIVGVINNYDIDNAEVFFENGSLWLGVPIPEPSAAAGLLGLLALIMAAHRRG